MMSTVGLQPASSKFARENFEKTLRKPVKLDYVRRFLSREDVAAVDKAHPNGNAYVWGVKDERAWQWGALLPDECMVLFRQSNRVVLRGIVTFKTINLDLASYLWGKDGDGKSWMLVYFLDRVYPLALDVLDVNRAAGSAPNDAWRGFRTILQPEASRVIDLVKEKEESGSNISVNRGA